jgi:hypothetical protein
MKESKKFVIRKKKLFDILNYAENYCEPMLAIPEHYCGVGLSVHGGRTAEIDGGSLVFLQK